MTILPMLRSQNVIQSANKEVLDRVDDFVTNAPLERNRARLPTGLIVTGPAASSYSTLFDQIATRTLARSDVTFVQLRAAESVNLKLLLKNLIRKIVGSSDDVSGRNEDDDDQEIMIQSAKRTRLLNYDLQIVLDWCQARDVRSVVIALQDSEAFETTVLSEAIQLLR